MNGVVSVVAAVGSGLAVGVSTGIVMPIWGAAVVGSTPVVGVIGGEATLPQAADALKPAIAVIKTRIETQKDTGLPYLTT